MKLSTKCRYGTRAMIEIARNYYKGPTKRKEIAASQDISEGYLENILSRLKNQHLVRTVRGANGGFVLEKKPGEITLYEIVIALEGSISPVDCIINTDICGKVSNCSARKAWQKLHLAQIKVLSDITLEDLIPMEPDAPSYEI